MAGFLTHFEQLVLVKGGAGRGQVVREETVTVERFGKVGFGRGELVLAFVGTVGQVLDSVVFIGLLIESRFSFFFIFGVVHGVHLYFCLFRRFFFKHNWVLFAKGLVLGTVKHGCFRGEIDRRFIIVFVHFRNVEGNEFGRGASLVL
jgi:hypothetical protein